MSVSEEELKNAFDSMDFDKNGVITKEDLIEICKSLSLEPSLPEIDKIIKKSDEDGDGKISFQEFKDAAQKE